MASLAKASLDGSLASAASIATEAQDAPAHEGAQSGVMASLAKASLDGSLASAVSIATEARDVP